MSEKLGLVGEPRQDYEVFDVPSDWGEQDSSRFGNLLQRIQLGLSYRRADFLRADEWHALTRDDEQLRLEKSEPTFTLLAVRQAVISAIKGEFPDKELQPVVVKRDDSSQSKGDAVIGLLPQGQELGTVLLRDETESMGEAVPALPLDHRLLFAGGSSSDVEHQMFRTVITVSSPESRMHARLGLLIGQDRFALPGLRHVAAQDFRLSPHVKEWARASGTPIL